MIKILHSGDWHLDSPLNGDERLKAALLRLPEQVAAVCREEGCDLVLLSGDLFDGKPSPDSLQALKRMLREVGVPTFISPGNHDFVTPDSVWMTESWPENVHIFLRPVIESVSIPALSCRIYGAGFDSMDCPPLLEGFRAQGEERYHIALLHGDPTVKNSPYNPVSSAQAGASGLTYLALGHIHKGGSLRSKNTLCAWPGCPMGRGFDETEEKGVLVAEIGEKAEIRFIPLDTPRFFDLEAEILTDAAAAVAACLPAVGNEDHYRIRITGEAEPLNLPVLRETFAQFPHLELRDGTVPPRDLWAARSNDSFEGVFFELLHGCLETEEENIVNLAAKISRRLLDGGEVRLP